MARRAELRAEMVHGVTSRAVESNAISASKGWQRAAWDKRR